MRDRPRAALVRSGVPIFQKADGRSHATQQLEIVTKLVNLHFVRAAKALTSERVFELVDSGRLRWVFNVSPVGKKLRDLRFLAEEVVGSLNCAGLTVDDALGFILGHKQTFRPGEIETQWIVSHQTIMRLRKAGEIEQINGCLTRASLAEFLRRRLQ